MRGLAAFRAAVTPGGVLAGPWVKDNLWCRAKSVPSLDLRFASNKSLVDATTGRNIVTFTRASSGTYVGSDGLIKTATTNEARFDHNPTTGESLGLLVEEQRTNLLLQSNQFDTTWTNTLSSETAAAGIAPDGTSTAWELRDTLDASASNHIISQGSITFTSGTAYTFSVFAKLGTVDAVGLIFPTAMLGTATIGIKANIANGTIIASAAGATNSITAYPNGWYRVTTTMTATTSGTGALQIRMAAAAGAGTSYQGTGNGTILIWGAQLEAGAFPTSYIPTTTATVTRSADVASITGANFSSWYRQDEGTVFAEASGVNNISGATRRYLEIRNTSSTERLVLGYATTTSNRFLVVDGGATVADVNVVSLPTAKAAGAYKVNSFQLASNGVLGTEDTVGTVPTPDQLQIGSQEGSSANTFINGTIRRLTYWPLRLSDSTLQEIAR
jgi:hypothetical protein